MGEWTGTRQLRVSAALDGCGWRSSGSRSCCPWCAGAETSLRQAFGPGKRERPVTEPAARPGERPPVPTRLQRSAGVKRRSHILPSNHTRDAQTAEDPSRDQAQGKQARDRAACRPGALSSHQEDRKLWKVPHQPYQDTCFS